jgi:hypothetical protein
MEHKNIEFKFTMTEGDGVEAGTFTGYASVFNVVDSYGDMVMPGAFKKTLKEKKVFPMCWSHDTREPIGVISGVEDDKGLAVTGKLNLDVQRAREIRSLMAQGAVKGLSIGYNVIKELIDRTSGIRQLKELNVWETSPCVFQACPEAEVGGVKSTGPEGDAPIEGKAELEAELKKFNESLIALQGKAEPPAGTPSESLAGEPPVDSDADDLRDAKEWRDYLASLL